jgi:aspartate carbamoyltransferase catalytic subunit
MHLLHSKDCDQARILNLFQRAQAYLPVVQERRQVGDAHGKILATLFFEPSTRTRFSFETAMLRLGGSVISNAEMGSTSSAKKGETLRDTGRVVSEFADVLAVRHPQQGSVDEMAAGSLVPVINAGDGPGDHPTQGLLDLFTIQRGLGRLDDFTIAMVGDLKYGRVVHAQCELLMNFKGIRFRFISPEELKMPAELVAELRAKGFEVEETADLNRALDVDVLSHTRIQQERFPSEADYLKHKGVYVLTPEFLAQAKEELMILHPLPRVDEIDPAVDGDARARYFEQVQNGVAVRMALIAELLNL